MKLKVLFIKLTAFFRPDVDSIASKFSKTVVKLNTAIQDQEDLTNAAEDLIVRKRNEITERTAKIKRASIFKKNLEGLMGLDSDDDGVPDMEQLND